MTVQPGVPSVSRFGVPEGLVLGQISTSADKSLLGPTEKTVRTSQDGDRGTQDGDKGSTSPGKGGVQGGRTRVRRWKVDTCCVCDG